MYSSDAIQDSVILSRSGSPRILSTKSSRRRTVKCKYKIQQGALRNVRMGGGAEMQIKIKTASFQLTIWLENARLGVGR
jgi:hypothetical protein